MGRRVSAGPNWRDLLNEAAILAARKGKEAVGDDDIQEAPGQDHYGPGAKEPAGIGEEERRLLAYHEAGHTVVATFVPHADPVYKVSIIPRGHAMGVTQQLPENEKYVYSPGIRP